MNPRRSKRRGAPRALRRKGRYLLLALATAGAWFAWRDPAPGDAARLAARSPGAHAAGCAVTPAFTPAPPPPARLTGRLGLFVAEIDPATLRVKRAVARDPDGVYPLASSYKQAVLWALLRAHDAGTLPLGERFEVTTASQSLGAYPFDHSDVLTLARRMIHNSDNTATDLLHRRVGLDAVQRVADDLKLCRTRLILPTKDWWVAQAGLSSAFPGASVFASATGEDRSRLAHALDADAQTYRADYLQTRLDRYFEERYHPDADLGTHNVSTPAEFAALVAHEFLRPGLSPASRTVQRDVMSSGYGRSRLQVPVRYFGGKGGNGWEILTYTGYLETLDGRHVVYAFMQHGAHETYTMPLTRTAFTWINAAIHDVLNP